MASVPSASTRAMLAAGTDLDQVERRNGSGDRCLAEAADPRRLEHVVQSGRPSWIR
jgi:hypothetical protein